MKRYYSSGKLMITGEYLVLCGAKALALPLRYGQELLAERNNSDSIHWKSLDRDGNIWFEGIYHPVEQQWESASDLVAANILRDMLEQCQELNSKMQPEGWKMQTKLEFDRRWGWGSSSTLINNLAQWAHVDAFRLSERTLGGSGYDIACAQSSKPIVYQIIEEKPAFEEIGWRPPFRDSIFFVFSGKKRDSRKATALFNREKKYTEEIKRLNELTAAILKAVAVTEFERLVSEHEAIIGKVLGQLPVQQDQFDDFPGVIKSLGAWGGDFVMAVSREDEQTTRHYFKSRNLSPVFRFDEIVSCF